MIKPQRWKLLRVVVETRVPPNSKGETQFSYDIQAALRDLVKSKHWALKEYGKITAAGYNRKRPYIEPNRKVTKTVTEVEIDVVPNKHW